MGCASAKFNIDDIEFGIAFKSAKSDTVNEIQAVIKKVGFERMQDILDESPDLKGKLDELADEDDDK